MSGLRRSVRVIESSEDEAEPESPVMIMWQCMHDAPEVARFVLVQVPSSAMAERVFSILTRLFGDNQSNTLEDMLELGVRTEMADTEFEKSLKEAGAAQ